MMFGEMDMLLYVVLVILLGSFASSTVSFFGDLTKRRIKRERKTNEKPLNPFLYGYQAVPRRINGDGRNTASLTKRPVMFDLKPRDRFESGRVRGEIGGRRAVCKDGHRIK